MNAEEYLKAVIDEIPAVGKPGDEKITLTCRGLRNLIKKAHENGSMNYGKKHPYSSDVYWFRVKFRKRGNKDSRMLSTKLILNNIKNKHNVDSVSLIHDSEMLKLIGRTIQDVFDQNGKRFLECENEN